MKARNVGIAVVGLAIVYVASSWFFGRQASHYLNEQKVLIAANPYLKLVSHKVESGIFSSTETDTYELTLPRLPKNGTNAAAAPIRFTAHSVIKHGPLPGLSTVGEATIHTELFPGEPLSPVIKQLYGDKPPVTVDTKIGFSGGGHQEISSPAVDAVLQDKTHLSWGAIRFTDDFQRHLAAYKLAGGTPFMKLEMPDGKGVFEVGAVAVKSDKRRLFEDNPYLYTGPVDLTVAGITVRRPGQPPVAVEQLHIGGNLVDKNGFLDASASYGAQSLKFGPKSFGPAQIDVAFRHIDARSLSDLDREYMKLAMDGKLFQPGKAPDPAVFKVLLKPATAILAKSPEFDIDKIDVKLPGGTVHSQLAVRLPNANVDPLQNGAASPQLLMMSLMASLQVDGQVAAPESLALSLAGPQRAEMLDQLIQQGYVTRENGMLSMKFRYSIAGFFVNGKKINPAMLAHRPQA